MSKRFSKFDMVLLGMLVVTYVPLSLWGGSEKWAGDTDLLPLIMFGIGAVYVIFESIRLCSPGLVPVLSAVVPLLTIGPSLFLYTRDVEVLPITVAMAYLFGLLASTVCWFVRGRVKVPLADWSMWLGVHSLFVTFLAVPAVICGHIALARTKCEPGSSTQRAIVGLVLGYIAVGILLILIIAITANT